MKTYQQLNRQEEMRAVDKCFRAILTSLITGERHLDGELQSRVYSAANHANRARTPWLTGANLLADGYVLRCIRDMAQREAEGRMYTEPGEQYVDGICDPPADDGIRVFVATDLYKGVDRLALLKGQVYDMYQLRNKGFTDNNLARLDGTDLFIGRHKYTWKALTPAYDFRLDIYDTQWTVLVGGASKCRLAYIFTSDGAVIFSGYEYLPAPRLTAMHNFKFDTLVEDLLSFFCIGEEDTDEEYFANYTKEQLAWRDGPLRAKLDTLREELAQNWKENDG